MSEGRKRGKVEYTAGVAPMEAEDVEGNAVPCCHQVCTCLECETSASPHLPLPPQTLSYYLMERLCQGVWEASNQVEPSPFTAWDDSTPRNNVLNATAELFQNSVKKKKKERWNSEKSNKFV